MQPQPSKTDISAMSMEKTDREIERPSFHTDKPTKYVFRVFSAAPRSPSAVPVHQQTHVASTRPAKSGLCIVETQRLEGFQEQRLPSEGPSGARKQGAEHHWSTLYTCPKHVHHYLNFFYISMKTNGVFLGRTLSHGCRTPGMTRKSSGQTARGTLANVFLLDSILTLAHKCPC